MKAEDLTKEQVNEMSDDEVVFWFKEFAEQEQTAQMRQRMLDQIEIREASRIHVDSMVVE